MMNTSAEPTQILAEIANLLRAQGVRTQTPWESVLWTAEDIGAHLQVSPRTVAEKYAPQPSFPRPVNPGGGHNRWLAHEIIDWIDSSRRPKPRRTPKVAQTCNGTPA